MSGLIDTTEMYLRTILELEEEGVVPMRARIAERLDQSGPTVSQTVARMERDGLVQVAGDRHLELTEEGRRLATRVMRKHRLAERLLTDVIGLEWELVHEEPGGPARPDRRTAGPERSDGQPDGGAHRDHAFLFELEDGAEIHLRCIDQSGHTCPSML